MHERGITKRERRKRNAAELRKCAKTFSQEAVEKRQSV